MMTETAKIVVHPSSRKAYGAERLRKAARLDDEQRRAFLSQALDKYRAWAAGLGVAPHKISADAAILEAELFPRPEKRRA